ncbi:MAG TPA: hypothetical protein VJY62_01985 [Bacteroidia bacterium]|nr:hypothetical protein [Bacteroidia bacterium]
MYKQILIIVLFISICFSAAAQNKKFLSLTISDNVNMQFISNDYLVTKDSIIIKGDSDYGRTKVNYMSRALTKTEKKNLEKFMKTFPADSLWETYFSEYNNMEYISPEHFPRVIEIKFEYKEKKYKTKMTNCYVYKAADLFDFLNPLFPPEVRIKFKKEDFNAFY